MVVKKKASAKKTASGKKAAKAVKSKEPAERAENGKKEDFSPTGVKNLDKNLGGGYPTPGVTLIEGPPGAGKTPVAIAFTDAGLKDGRKTIYVCMNNFPDEIKKIAGKISYNVDNAEFIDSYSWLVGKKSQYFDAPALDPTKILQIMEDVLKQGPIENLVLDSISTMLLYHDERTVQKFAQAFVAMVKEYDACALIVLESKTAGQEMRSTLEYLTDASLFIEKDKLTVVKMMGAEVGKREMRFAVAKKGVEID